MTTNAEQSVIDEIDALVNEQMAGGEIAAERRAEVIASDRDRCALCKGAWHGAPWVGVDYKHLGEYDQHHHGRRVMCPGAYATGPQRIRYRWKRQGRRLALGARLGVSTGHPWLVSIGQNHPVADRMFDNLGNPMRELGGQIGRAAGSLARLNNPIERAHRSMTNVYNALDTLGVWDGVNVEPWQREVISQWYGGNSDLPEQMRALEGDARSMAAESDIPAQLLDRRSQGGSPFLPMPYLHTANGSDFQYVGNLADAVNTIDIEVDDPDIEAVRYSTSPNYRGGQIQGPRGGGSVAAWLDEPGSMRSITMPDISILAGATVPERFMASAGGGREAVRRFGAHGPTLMTYWGAPSAAGSWWELDLWNGRVWKSIDISTEIENARDYRNRSRRGQTFPPTRSTRIELTTDSGQHINPIGVIAVGANNRDGSHHILRAYVKSHDDYPPVLYGYNRHPTRHQPISWARRDLPVGRHPQQLVAMIREAERV